MAPEYADAATLAKSLDPPVLLAKVDATEEMDLAQRFGVQGFPTIKWFVNASASDYTGNRESCASVFHCDH